jgi:hypothetical protein
MALGFLERILREDEEREAAERGVPVDAVRAERAARIEAAAAREVVLREKERKRELAVSAAFVEASGLPFRFHVAVAYHPRQGPNMHGGRHLVLDEDFAVGRLARTHGQALCSPRRFWGLERMMLRDAAHGRTPTFDDLDICPDCRRRAEAVLGRRRREAPRG